MKIQERRLAKELFMKGKAQKEIAALVKVGEKTVGKWVLEGGWKAERTARTSSDHARINSLKTLISSLTEQRLAIMHQSERCKDSKKRAELEQRGIRLSTEVANYNKALENLQNQNRISLGVYLDVMEQIFNALQEYNPKIYLQLLQFQEDHLATVATQYE